MENSNNSSSSYGTNEYYKDVQEDKAALNEAYEKALDNENLKRRVEEIEVLLAKLKEELDNGPVVQNISGDPSSQKERFDVEAYNRDVDRKRGQKMFMDSKTGLVSSRPEDLQ